MLRSMIQSGCSVGFFGIGSSNVALMRCLPLEKCRITLRSDSRIDRSALPRGLLIDRIFEGEAAYKNIDEDVIFFSPSVRREREELKHASERGVVFCSDCELFFEENRQPVFAVSGSDGKSTTAALTHLLLRAGRTSSELIGNIGEPMINGLNGGADMYVCELSSFMLSYCQPRVKRACITNITPNHLDWHADFEEYRKSKLSLIKNAEKYIISEENANIGGAYGIISDSTAFKELRQKYKAEVYMTLEGGYILRNGERLLAISDVKRRELHNIKNLMMAIAMTDGYAGKEEILKAAQSFGGLSHRCETVLRRGGIDFIDSSIDSTPARTAETLRSLDRQVVIILGGRGKGLDYATLVPTLKKYAKFALIVGENAEEIYETIGNTLPVEVFSDFEAAVRRGATLAREVGTLLLSPASTSYDRFKNYARRGEKFKEILLKTQ